MNRPAKKTSTASDSFCCPLCDHICSLQNRCSDTVEAEESRVGNLEKSFDISNLKKIRQLSPDKTRYKKSK